MPTTTTQCEATSSAAFRDVIPVSSYPVAKPEAGLPITAPSAGGFPSSPFSPFSAPLVVASRQDAGAFFNIPLYQRTGHWIVPWCTVIAIFAGFFAAAKLSVDNEAAVLHLFLALLPIKIILFALRVVSQQRKWCLPTPLIHEMLWMGPVVLHAADIRGIFSILIASITETVSETQTRGVWDCQTTKPSILCDVRLAIVFIVTVGFVEEVSKLFPVFRFWSANTLDSFPKHCRWCFRYAETPQTLALSGLCCGLGFAAVENVLYIMNLDPSQSIAASFWRAILAVPFHLAGTLYASVKLAEVAFAAPTPPARFPRGQHRTRQNNDLNVSLCDDPELSQTRNRLKDTLLFFCPCFRYWRCIWLPSLLHGLYDTGLSLAVQLSRLSRNALTQDKLVQHTALPSATHVALAKRSLSTLFTESNVPSFFFLDRARSSLAPTQVLAQFIESLLLRPGMLLASAEASSPEDALYWSKVYAGLANACFLMTLISYGLMLGCSVEAFKKLPAPDAQGVVLRDVPSPAYAAEDPLAMYYDRAYPIPYVYYAGGSCPPYSLATPYNAFVAPPAPARKTHQTHGGGTRFTP